MGIEGSGRGRKEIWKANARDSRIGENFILKAVRLSGDEAGGCCLETVA